LRERDGEKGHELTLSPWDAEQRWSEGFEIPSLPVGEREGERGNA